MGTFNFKQFSVEDTRSAMKVGTDGVLLGAWVSLDGTEDHILDVGTGSGVIALMLAQRTSKATVIGIDIDAPSAEDASDNFKKSPWAGRMAAFCTDFRNMKQFPYELIVSNPPFFVNSLKAPDARRSDARHTDTLSYAALASGAVANMAPNGRLAVVLPSDESELFIEEARGAGLFLRRICRVRTTPKQPFKRSLMEFSKNEGELLEEQLTIQNSCDFTSEYKSLTKDFYLKF